MADLRAILNDHEASIISRIASLRAELVPLERELMEVRLAKAAVRRTGHGPDQPQLFLRSSSDENSADHVATWRQHVVLAHRTAPTSPYARLTIKELVKKALSEHFQQGATAAELLDLFENAWGRDDIARTSLSPQLSRLGAEGILFRRGQVWRLKSSIAEPAHTEKTATDH